MKRHFAVTALAGLTLAALTACSKPATQPAATDTAASNPASANVTSPGGAVSPPAANGAINPDANKASSETAAASNSFTEGEAKGHIENAGYTDVTDLVKTPDGLWSAKAKKAGKPVQVAVDFKGAVAVK